jgi:hypothetical protein
MIIESLLSKTNLRASFLAPSSFYATILPESDNSLVSIIVGKEVA